MNQKYISKFNLTTLTMIETLRVSSKGQVVIPEQIRKKLKIGEGTKLVLVERNNKLTLETEKQFMDHLNQLELKKEDFGWLMLAEKSMEDLWDNEGDEKVWKKYLKK